MKIIYKAVDKMANLNLPFLLLQPSTCSFEPSLKTTKLIAFDKYNNPRVDSVLPTGQPEGKNSIVGAHMRSVGPINQSISSTTTYSHQGHHFQGANRTNAQKTGSSTKFEFGKYSTFDDTPQSLVISGDSRNGTMILFNQDVFVSAKHKPPDVRLKGPLPNGAVAQRVNRNLVSLVPRVSLLPSISQESGPLMASCLVRSPAPNILSTSTFLLVTIHQDGIIRLWTTDDGRCILASSADLLNSNPAGSSDREYSMCALSSSTSSQYHIGALSGVVAVSFTGSPEVLFVNTYRMTVVRRIAHGIPESKLVKMKVGDKRILLEDRQRGCVHVWKREGGPAQDELTISVKSSFLNQSFASSGNPASQQSLDSSSQSEYHLALDVSNSEDSKIAQMLNYKQEFAMSKAESDGRILTKRLIGGDNKLLIVFTNGICLCSSTEKKLLMIPKKSLTFAKFFTTSGSTQEELLFAVDTDFSLIVYDVRKIMGSVSQQDSRIFRANLFEDSTIFEPYCVKQEGSKDAATAFGTDSAEERLQKLESLRKALTQESLQFRFSGDLKTLYTVLKIAGECKLIQWNLEKLVENLGFQSLEATKDEHLPLTLTPMRVFTSTDPPSLLNFQPLLIKSFYNPRQFSFFYADERVTDSAIYTSSQQPAYLVGTNYGRLFITPLFQESDDRVQPVLVVDAHHGSPITRLFVAYNSARRQTGGKGFLRITTTAVSENGGHLISVSEDGTICVTNLNSGEINKALHNFNVLSAGIGVDKHDYHRAEQFFREREESRKLKRRNSFSNDCSVQKYFHLAKVRPQKVFPNAVFGKVDKILEVKNVNKIRAYITKKHPQPTDDRKSHVRADPVATDDQGAANGPLYYAVVSSEGGTVHILHITNLSCDMIQFSGLDSKSTIQGVYQDALQNQIFVLSFLKDKKLPKPPKSKPNNPPQAKLTTPAMQFYVFNAKSNLLLRKLDQRQALDVLLVKETVDYLLTKHGGFRAQQGKGSQIFDYESFQQFFQKSEGGLMGLGSHKLLDYLSLALNMPLEYHPHSVFSTKYTKTLLDLVAFRRHLAVLQAANMSSQKVPQGDLEEAQRQVLIALNEAYFANNRLYKSDFNEDYFERHAGITCLQAGAFGSRQDLLVANGKQIQRIFQAMVSTKPVAPPQANIVVRVVTTNDRVRSPSPVAQTVNVNGAGKLTEDNDEFELYEEEKASSPHQIPQMHGIKSPSPQQQPPHQNKLATCKWPTRLLSLLHPFNVEENLDKALERLTGINLPFLDFRVGVQGAEESFSFVMTREDEDFHSERNNPRKIIRMLRLSLFKRKLIDKLQQQQKQQQQPARLNQQMVGQANSIVEVNQQLDQLLDSEPSARFFGSEYWKVSNYLSTVIPAFFLTMLASIVDQHKEEATYMLQEWLFIVQRINQQRTLTESSRISLSAASKILIKKDPCISSTGRDVLLKPVLFALVGTDRLQDVIDEWTSLVVDTYKKLRQETTLKATYGGGASSSNQVASTQASTLQDKRLVNQYFGELEIRGLICISYYALYNHDQLDAQLQYRVSKLTTILTREIVDKFNSDRRYIHLLTHLLQLLSTWMKMQNNQFNQKAMIGEVIGLLLFIYNINKSPMYHNAVITRVTGENFYLIKPTQPELYLKLTAAKALLEIGENYTHDFLLMVQDEATHLNQGPEYQQNVLEILKIFINSSCSPGNSDANQHSGVNLEHHLIQITQILLKCFDPNELALRKSSLKVVSLILSIMVKMFPMVAFHHESQRLAVGTHDGPIAIYDMRTSAKWKILEGHTGNITCLSFDSKGNLLASYSATDLSLQLWKVGNTGFFSTIMGGTSKSANKIHLKHMPANVRNPHNRRTKVSLQQQEFNTNDSIFEHPHTQQPQPQEGAGSTHSISSRRVNCCYIKFVQPKEKEVDLVRENGERKRYKLVK